ncbi:unnamed protein product [Rhizophagus irregularis]|nr:unnamed protein product [Rhizophagus irregularis]
MNSNEDWYQTAIKKFKINEILYKKFSGKPTRIGRGGFGLIYKTECNSIGTVAIKEITIGIEDDEACIKNFINELKIHSRTEHERILQFYGISRNIDEGLYYLVLEYANQGNLREFLIKKKSCDNCFEWEERVRLAVQIVEGLGYLHEVLNVAHRDLHTKNILINDGNIKISDFGFCWETEPNSRPLIEGVLSRLKSMSLEPVFEEDDKISTISLFQYRDTSRDSTSEYSNNVSSLTIPDDLILPTNNVTCKRCDSKFTDQNWCYDCEAQKFQEDFPNWTSENESLDELIQYSQLSAITNDTYFEWINFNRFNNIENMHSLYYEFYTAIWLDGSRELWDNRSQQWARTGPVKIILRRLKYLTINKLKLYLELKNIIICCYGFTQDPKTKYYYIVLKYANGGILQQYIKNKFPLSWFERLSILKKIVELLHNIHKTNYVYRNLHSGNILLQEDDLNHKLEIYVSDLDSCIYSDYKMRKELYVYTSNIAPENLRGEIISIKSDIYNLGVIMRELTLGNYYNINNPQCYHELMQKCLDNDPENRPNTLDLLEELHIFTASPLRKRQFEDADSRGLQPLQISPPLQKNKRLINPSSEYFSNQFSRGADYSFF